jgi:hypothetical protein
MSRIVLQQQLLLLLQLFPELMMHHIVKILTVMLRKDFKVEAASKTLISITSGRIVFCNTEGSVHIGRWSHMTKNMALN